MKRREFIALLGGTAAALPLAARAQQSERTWRIGVLMSAPADDKEGQARINAFVARCFTPRPGQTISPKVHSA